MCQTHYMHTTGAWWAQENGSELKAEDQRTQLYSPKISLVYRWVCERYSAFQVLYHSTCVSHAYVSPDARKGVVQVTANCSKRYQLGGGQYLQLDLGCQAAPGHPVLPAGLAVQAHLVVLPCQAVPDFPQAHGNLGLQDYRPGDDRGISKNCCVRLILTHQNLDKNQS